MLVILLVAVLGGCPAVLPCPTLALDHLHNDCRRKVTETVIQRQQFFVPGLVVCLLAAW